MFCVKCKSEIPDNSVFCLFCGKKQSLSEKKQNPKSRGNGTGTAYKLPSGKWRAVYTYRYTRDMDGKLKKYCKTKSGFKTKKEALNYLSILSEKKEKKKQITIYEAYAAIQPKLEKLSDKRRQCYASAYKHIKHIEMNDMSAFSIADLQAAIDDIDGGFYTKRYVKDLLSKVFNYAVADGIIDRNIVPYIELPQNTPKSEKTIFTNSEISKLWEAWNNGVEFAGYILILIYCGLRTGELWSIKSADVDFERHIMTGGIKNAMGKYAPIFIIPLIEPVVRHFTNKHPTGTLYNSYSVDFYREWRNFKHNMNFRENLQPYSGRHSCASACARAGLPEAVIMSIMRHEKYDTTLKYTHIDTDTILSKMKKVADEELCY